MKSETQGENVVLVHDEWCDIHDNKLVIAISIQCDGNSYVCCKHKICTVSCICNIWNQKRSYWIIWVSSDSAGDDKEKRCSTQGRMIMTPKKCGLCSHLLNLLWQDVSKCYNCGIIRINPHIHGTYLSNKNYLCETTFTLLIRMGIGRSWLNAITHIWNRPYLLMIVAQNEKNISKTKK